MTQAQIAQPDLEPIIKRPIWRSLRLQTALALAALLVWIVCLTRPVFLENGLPQGVEVHPHLAILWYVANVFQKTGSVPQWLPFWYNGTALLQYYPVLATYLALPIQLLTKDISVTF